MTTVVVREVPVVTAAERTRDTYRAIAADAPYQCPCAFCMNFRALGTTPFPEDVLGFFDAAGIDLSQPAETYEYHETSQGKHLYGGEYYFFGDVPLGDSSELDTSGVFDFVFTSPSPLAQEKFKVEGAVCFQFIVEVPWVIAVAP